MSRIANNPVQVPSSADIKQDGQQLTISGPKGKLEYCIHGLVEMKREENELLFRALDESKAANALAGTTRSLVQNMIIGVVDGFEKKLELTGCRLSCAGQGKNP